jgi:hypothetical protein
MYKDIKSNSKSDYFPCDNGVRQGENLYPFLFATFLNDLEEFFFRKPQCYRPSHNFTR